MATRSSERVSFHGDRSRNEKPNATGAAGIPIEFENNGPARTRAVFSRVTLGNPCRPDTQRAALAFRSISDAPAVGDFNNRRFDVDSRFARFRPNEITIPTPVDPGTPVPLSPFAGDR